MPIKPEYANGTSVLLLDDNADVGELYKRQIEKGGGIAVTAITDAVTAIKLAMRQLFDVVIVDAKLTYRGIEFGGLRLADEIRPRYGGKSILVISRYITQSLMQSYEADHEFLAKPNGLDGQVFGERLRKKIAEMRKEQYVFVAMPFASEYQGTYDRLIKPSVRAAGFRCVRMDEDQHTRGIQERIFELVRGSKLVVFLADGANPNAYYEAGFADAMQKEVVILAKSCEELRFDVSNRNTISHGRDIRVAKEAIIKKINGLRHQKPMGI